MKHLIALRYSLFAAALGAALCVPAHAATPDISAPGKVAYSTFPATYDFTDSWLVNPLEEVGFQFTPTRSGELASISVMIGNEDEFGGPASVPFTVSLYSDDDNELGTLLGTYDGNANQLFFVMKTPVVIPASGVTITTGKKYWLVADCDVNTVQWDYSGGSQYGFFTEGDPIYETIPTSAFNIRVK